MFGGTAWVQRLEAGAKARVHRLFPGHARFAGAWPSYAEAAAAVPPGKLVGYDHDELVEVGYEEMCQVAPWDYPVLFWMQRLLSETSNVLDAGGHMGTKFRAFQRYLHVARTIRWTVYDLPAIVAAGRERAERDGLTRLDFIDDLAQAPTCSVLLASGLLQYTDMPLQKMLSLLPTPPDHIILNKVAVRDGITVFTHENFGSALVPYQIRCRSGFFAELQSLGYEPIDQWEIPSLSHKIATHPELGSSESIGVCLRKRT